MANKSYRRIKDSDIKIIVSELDQWALGNLGSKPTWAMLEKRFGFSRQALEAKADIKSAYDNAKEALSGGLVKTKAETSKENEELLCEINRLNKQTENLKEQELRWKKRWQRIAFHIRQKGLQVEDTDTEIPNEAEARSMTETDKILRPFDKKIPSSGRT